MPEAEREARWEELVSGDRLERFDSGTPPLLRFTLVRFGSQHYRLIFTHHHLLLDGWSTPLLIGELLTGSAPARRGTSYRDYLAWLAAQDRNASIAAWQEVLHGLEEGTLFSRAGTRTRDNSSPIVPETLITTIPAAMTSRLTVLARAEGLTLNTLVQGAWAILLGRTTGREDVVFGATVSGRTAELPGMEGMIGLLINTLPVRVRLRQKERLLAMLRRLQEEQSSLISHQYVGLAEIQHAAGLGELFDTLVVFENYPVDRDALESDQSGLRIRGVEGHNVTHYALCLAVIPGTQMTSICSIARTCSSARRCSAYASAWYACWRR